MKKPIPKFISSIAAFLLAATVCWAAVDLSSTGRIPVKSLDVDRLAYQAGEHLTFQMHYKWGLIDSNIGYGEVRLDTLTFQGRRCFKTIVTGGTTRLYDHVFKVRENFQSIFTCDGLVPMEFSRDSHEGPYVSTNRYSYHRNGEQSYISAHVFTSSRGVVEKELPCTEDTYDLPSLFYLARNMDFSKVVPGVKHPMTFAVDDEVYNVYFIMYGKETIKVRGLGSVRTIKFAAKLLAGEVFTGKEDMYVWVTDDDNRIPVYFEAPILVGVASGWLTGWSGLKHSFSSLIRK